MSTNSLSTQLEDVNRLQSNGLKIMTAFNDAVISNQNEISVELENNDGSISTVNIPSNIFLKQNFDNLNTSFQDLLNVNNGTSIITSDDEYREVVISSYKDYNSKIENATLSTQVNVGINSMLDNFLSPLTTININIPTRLLNSQKLRIDKFSLYGINANDNFALFSNNEKYKDVKNRLNSYPFKSSSFEIELNRKENRYNGVFDILSLETQTDSTIKCTLSKLTYSDTENIVDESKELKVGDKLIDKDGINKFEITLISENTITLKRLAGLGILQAGIGMLEYLNEEVITNTFNLPISGGERSIIFISSVTNDNKVSEKSNSILIDSRNFTVTENNIDYKFDTYFSSKVLNLGKYFDSIVKENSISITDGVVPNTPNLTTDGLKVVQINKHITNNGDIKKLKTYQSQKTKINTELDYINSKIYDVDTRLRKGNYKSSNDKENDKAELTDFINRKEILSTEYQSIVQTITNISESTNITTATPKYRIRGFWNIDEPISPITNTTQRIVQYRIQYRYISPITNISESTNIDMNGENGIISSWNETLSTPLRKTYNTITDSYSWQQNNIEDGNVNNINQLDIPISFGEEVEIRIQALSEVGYPLNPLTSEWSTIVKVEFPEELKNDETIQTITTANKEDLTKVQVQKEFSSQGVTNHVASSFTELDRYFAHSAENIASGFFTDEQTTISAFQKFKLLENSILQMQEKLDRRTLTPTIQIIDSNNEVHQVNNYSTVSVFGGYYTDNIDLSNVNNYGKIVQKKMNLKISNLNANSIELLSLNSGGLNENISSSLYDSQYLTSSDNNTPLSQKLGQIFYLRNQDITNSESLVSNTVSTTEWIVPTDEINNAATETEKNTIYYDGNNFNKIKLQTNASYEGYVATSKNNPLYINYVANGDSTALKEYITNAKYYSNVLKSDYIQSTKETVGITKFGNFDQYLIGRDTLGARLYIEPLNMTNIQVNGSDTSAIKLLNSGEENAIIIPIIFEYRMTDILGNLNGDNTLSLSGSNIEYKKKIGIDMLVNNELFKFDLLVNCKFRPTSISNNNLNITALTSNNLVSSTTPNIN